MSLNVQFQELAGYKVQVQEYWTVYYKMEGSWTVYSLDYAGICNRMFTKLVIL